MLSRRTLFTGSGNLLLCLYLILLSPHTAHAVDYITSAANTHSIISGTQSGTGAQPWIAALVRKDENLAASKRQTCTAALVDRYWVVTAAHCLQHIKAEDYEVIVGRDDLDSDAGEVFNIAELVPVPLGWDIGLIRLQTPSSASAIEMASSSQEKNWFGQSLTVYGWGNTYYRAPASARCLLRGIGTQRAFTCKTYVFKTENTNSAILQQANVRLQNYDSCNTRFKNAIGGGALPFQFGENSTPDLLCAWDPLEKSTPCYGDSGGPLVAMDGGKPVLVGVTSFGALGGCSPLQQIGAYMRVSYFRDYLGYRIAGDPALSFAQLCPAQVRPAVSVEPLPSGESRVQIRWTAIDKATAYRLFFATVASQGQHINNLLLDKNSTQMTVTLPGGSSYHVKLQAQGASCDGPMSELLTVVTP